MQRRIPPELGGEQFELVMLAQEGGQLLRPLLNAPAQCPKIGDLGFECREIGPPGVLVGIDVSEIPFEGRSRALRGRGECWACVAPVEARS